MSKSQLTWCSICSPANADVLFGFPQLNLMHEQYPVGQAVSAVVLSIDWRLHQLNLSFRTAQSDRAIGAALHGAIQTEAPSTMYWCW